MLNNTHAMNYTSNKPFVFHETASMKSRLSHRLRTIQSHCMAWLERHPLLTGLFCFIGAPVLVLAAVSLMALIAGLFVLTVMACL